MIDSVEKEEKLMINRIGVLGAGLMGNGIAQVFATGNKQVVLYDVSDKALQKGMDNITKSLGRLVKAGKLTEDQTTRILANISTASNIEEAARDVDLIVEAVPENLKLKQDIFKQLEEIAKEDAIFATNTSELSVTAIGSVTKRADKVIGMHFFNPPPMMKLIEIVRSVDTSQETVDSILKLSEEVGKETIIVLDKQGFVTSRALAAHMLECMRIYEEGIASKEDIDKGIRLGLNYPMGPLELADYVGLDTLLFACEGMIDAYGDRFLPPQILRKLVEAGHLGRKTVKVFYSYDKA